MAVIALLVAVALLAVGTVSSNMIVARAASGRTFRAESALLPHNRVGLLLGTSPLTRTRHTNTYFMNRIEATAELFRSGKIDYVIASGDNATMQYNEPIAMRDSLISCGVPPERIVLDYAGFRTLDSVVRAKKVFGCDSLTIITQSGQCERAMFLARANGIEAVGCVAPVHSSCRVRFRQWVRELLARDKMMLDLLVGKGPRFLGEMIPIPGGE